MPSRAYLLSLTGEVDVTIVSASAVLLASFLFGGTVLYSFGFAAFLFINLPAEQAGPLIRKAFPHFYLWMIVTAALSAIVFIWVDTRSALLLAIVSATTIPARQLLMPAVNRATDTGDSNRFKKLHSFSVIVTLVHIGIIGYVLVRLTS